MPKISQGNQNYLPGQRNVGSSRPTKTSETGEIRTIGEPVVADAKYQNAIETDLR